MRNSIMLRSLLSLFLLIGTNPALAHGKGCSRSLDTITHYEGGTGDYLDLSAIAPGLESLFERLANGAVFTGSAGTFVCEACGEVQDFAQIDDVPNLTNFPCTSCGKPVDFNQKNLPPLIVINHGGQNYVMKHSILRNEAVAAYFRDAAVGCNNCGTFYIDSKQDRDNNGVADGQQGCPGCGSTDKSKFKDVPLQKYSYGQIIRNPELLIRPLVEVGIIPINVAKEKKLLSRRDLFMIEQRRYVELGTDYDELALVKRAILNGSIHPHKAVQEGWIKLDDKREALTDLIRDGKVDVHDALIDGWIAKGWATSHFDVDETRQDIAALPDLLPGQKARPSPVNLVEREQDFGDEDQNITGNVNRTAELAVIQPSVFERARQWARDLDPGIKRNITIAGASFAVAAAMLFSPLSEKVDSVTSAKVVEVNDVGYSFFAGYLDGRERTAREVMLYYAEKGEFLDPKNPPPLVEISGNYEMEGEMRIKPVENGFPTPGYDVTMRNVHLLFENSFVRTTSIPYSEKDTHPVYGDLDIDDVIKFRFVNPDGSGQFDFDLERVE